MSEIKGMTVKDLRDVISDLKGNVKVRMSKDPEGNAIHDLHEVSGVHLGDRETGKITAIILWPLERWHR